MRFGFTIFPYDMFDGPGAIAKVVRRADELGFDYVTFPDHVALAADEGDKLGNHSRLDFPTLAAYLSAQTRRIEFVSGVYILPLCNPFRLARQIATLDQVSGGRVALGIGVGWNEQEFKTMRVPFERRGAIANEYIAGIKMLWMSEPASFAGEYIRFENISFTPKPVRKIPILTGGAAASGPFQRIATLCDGWIPWKVERHELARALEGLGEMLARHGRRLEDLDLRWPLSLGLNSMMARGRNHVGAQDATPLGFDKPLADEIKELATLGVKGVQLSFPANTADDLLSALERFASDHLDGRRAG
jgi:probable F420-dependent oxidoreductase